VPGALAQGGAALKVMVFPGLTNFPIYVAQQNGLFAKYGLTIELLAAPNSIVQRNGLAKGEHQIIHTAADNPVAMVELAKSDAVIVTGGDNGFNHIIVQPEIKSLSDLRGKTVVVDAPNTAFALLLYKALKSAGLNKGDYVVKPVGGTDQRMTAMKDKANPAAAGIMGLPFNFLAVAGGLKDMGAATRFVGATNRLHRRMRDWAKANSDTPCVTSPWSSPPLDFNRQQRKPFSCWLIALSSALLSLRNPTPWHHPTEGSQRCEIRHRRIQECAARAELEGNGAQSAFT
jgi:ABC-type nitrate/sulfonate/bicarbonate transport system substrate-binding protein